MKQRITPGAEIDILTPHEFHRMLARPVRVTRIRAPETIALDATGSTASSGPVQVYKVPAGAEFEVRRISFDLTSVTSANLAAGSISLNAPGNYVRYMRSGQHIEYANPSSPVSTTAKVPGVQTWGDQQGPYLRGGDVFQIDCTLTPGLANQTLSVLLEGLLTENRPGA